MYAEPRDGTVPIRRTLLICRECAQSMGNAPRSGRWAGRHVRRIDPTPRCRFGAPSPALAASRRRPRRGGALMAAEDGAVGEGLDGADQPVAAHVVGQLLDLVRQRLAEVRGLARVRPQLGQLADLELL